MQSGTRPMDATDRIKRANLERTRELAQKIIEANKLHPEQFASDEIFGRTIYQDVIDYVWPTIERLTPRVLGEIVSCGIGHPAKRIGTRMPDSSRGTSLMDVNGSTQFLIEASWDGLAILRMVAASVIIAQICDELGIDAQRYSTGTPRRIASPMN